MASLVILKAKNARQHQLASLRAKSESVVDDIRKLDEILEGNDDAQSIKNMISTF